VLSALIDMVRVDTRRHGKCSTTAVE